MMESSVKTTRIYEKVVEKLKEEIADGRLLPGDPLPSERQLMETFGVSRSSLREAFRVMELLGLIESIAGKGRFVRQPREIAEDQRKGIQLEDSAILELMEARRILDPAIAGESAMRATPSDLMRLLRVITATEEHLALPRDRAQADFDGLRVANISLSKFKILSLSLSETEPRASHNATEFSLILSKRSSLLVMSSNKHKIL